MNTALEKLESAIHGERERGEHFLFVTFQYGGFEFEYQGRYYAYVHPIGDSRARVTDEYGWNSFEEMLDGMITQTGKTVRAMLAELPAHDLEIEFDIPIPPHATRADEP